MGQFKKQYMIGGLVLGALAILIFSYMCACKAAPAAAKMVESFVDTRKTNRDPNKAARDVLDGVGNPQEADIIVAEAVPRFI